jgi:spermidine/putrescine transport system permease protein
VTALLLTPATAYFVIFFVVPLAILTLYSFYTYSNYSWTSRFTLTNYQQVLSSAAFRSFFLRTVWIALLVSVIVVIASYFFSYILTYVLHRSRRVLYFLVLVSLFGGYLVRIYAWRTMLGRDGIVNKALMAVGLVSHPINSLLNSDLAIILAMVNFLIPLGVLPIYSAMQNISSHLFEAAIDLGASRTRTARTIVLPLSARGIKAAFGFTFIATMAEWVTPQLVGGPLNQFVGNAIQYQFDYTLDWPLGAALALTLIVIMIALLGLLFLLLRLVYR